MPTQKRESWLQRLYRRATGSLVGRTLGASLQ